MLLAIWNKTHVRSMSVMLMLQASRKLVQRFSRPPPAQLRLAAGVGHPVVEQQPPPAANLDQSSEIETNFEPTPSGWMPPRGLPAEPGKQYSPDDPNYIPFSVRRSRTNNISVYQTYKSGRSRVITDIKKIEGDIYAMEKMLRKHLDVPDLLTRVDEVLGVISIYGKYKDEVKTWLKSLGF